MSTPTITLPAPPNADRLWSITTLAEYLCVAPAQVDALLTPDGEGSTDNSDDLQSARIGGADYVDTYGETCADCWLWTEAAERIADELPAGVIARQIVADGSMDAVRMLLAQALIAAHR